MNWEVLLVQEVKNALREKNAMRVSVLRMAQAALHYRLLEKRSRGKGEALTEEEALAVLRTEAKKRREAASAFQKGGRPDLAAKEEQELTILEAYLPPEMSNEALEQIIDALIAESGGAGQERMGALMQAAMRRVGGKASGARVRDLVEQRLRIP